MSLRPPVRLDGKPRREPEETAMKRKKHKPEEVIAKLRKADAMLGEGKSVAEVVQALAVTEATYYRWRRQYGDMGRSEAKRLKELDKENDRLKRLVAELSLDNRMLKDIVEGKV